MADTTEQNDSQTTEDEQLEKFLRKRAQKLAEESANGALGTLDSEGYPYNSFVELIYDGDEHFWMLLSDLATHSSNIGRDARASLLLTDETSTDEDEQDLQMTRGTFMGRIVEMDDRRDEVESRYLDAHPHAEQFINFSDFRFYRFRIERVKMVAGFGRVGWVEVAEFGDSE